MESTEPDIVVATETWLTSDVKDSELDCDGYTVYRRDRQNGLRGGVLIAVSNTINSTEAFRSSESETLWVKVLLKGQKHLLVGACYRPNVADRVTIPALEKDLSTLLDKKPVNLIIAGDFNFPGWKWSHDSRSLKPNTHYTDLRTEFGNTLDSFNLKQLVTESTRKENILDLLATNIPHRVNICRVIPGISDHDGIPYLELSLKVNKKKAAPRTINIYRRADWDGLKAYISEKITSVQPNPSVEVMWSTFKSIMQLGVEKLIPKKRIKSKQSQPWISFNLHAKKKKGHIEIEERFKTLKRACQRQFRQEHRAYVSKMLTEDGKTQLRLAKSSGATSSAGAHKTSELGPYDQMAS